MSRTSAELILAEDKWLDVECRELFYKINDARDAKKNQAVFAYSVILTAMRKRILAKKKH